MNNSNDKNESETIKLKKLKLKNTKKIIIANHIS